MKPNKEVALPVVKRLPRYYRFFTALEQEGREHVSSRELASMMGLTASQIRQDFNAFDLAGQQGFGYDIAHIREGLARILRFSERKKVILLGAGNLGRAIAEHMDFEGKGFELAAIFDSDPAVAGTSLRRLVVRDESSLADFCRTEKPDAAILCVPSDAAPELTRQLYGLGVRAFWNFSHYNISAAYPDAAVVNVHLSDSLMTLSYIMGGRSEE